jgi:hypothetical protein
MRLPLVMKDVSKRSLQQLSKCYSVAGVTKMFKLKGIQTIHLVRYRTKDSLYAIKCKSFRNMPDSEFLESSFLNTLYLQTYFFAALGQHKDFFFTCNLNRQSEFTFHKLMLCLLQCLEGESSSGESPVPQIRSIGQFLLSRLFSSLFWGTCFRGLRV